MQKLRKNWKTLLSVGLALALTIGTGIHLRGSSVFAGGGYDTGGGGSSGGGSPVSSGDFKSVGTAGYRVYFAVNTLGPTGYETDPHFQNNTATEMLRFRDIALYEFYNWEGNAPAAGQQIWAKEMGEWRSACLTLGQSADNPCNFEELGYTGSVDIVNYSQTVNDTGYNSFDSFGQLSLQTEIGTVDFPDLGKRLERYKDVVSNMSLSSNQQSELADLQQYSASDLMMVFEPVFVSQSADGYYYTISNTDWNYDSFGHLANSDTSYRLSTRCDKLDKVWTSFQDAGVDYNPDDDYRWKGFIIYNKHNTKVLEDAIGIGYNFNFQYTKSLASALKHQTEGGYDNFTLSAGMSETIPSTNDMNNTFKNDIGDPLYATALHSIGELGQAGFTTDKIANVRLLMAGQTFNEAVWTGAGGIPIISWNGTSKNYDPQFLNYFAPPGMEGDVRADNATYANGILGQMDSYSVNSIL